MLSSYLKCRKSTASESPKVRMRKKQESRDFYQSMQFAIVKGQKLSKSKKIVIIK